MSVLEAVAVAEAPQTPTEATPTDKVRRVLQAGPLLLPTHKIARRAGLSNEQTQTVLEALEPTEVVRDPHTMSWSNLGKYRPRRRQLAPVAN
jgi:hypothetical protein